MVYKMSISGNLGGGGVAEVKIFSNKRAKIRKKDKNSHTLRDIYSKFISFLQ